MTDPLTSLSLTHVKYDVGDPVAKILAYISLFPILLVVAELTVVVSRRELSGLFFFVGQLCCELLNAFLKATLREQRPHHPLLQGPVGKGYGMPSSHAQFMGFTGCLFILWLWLQLKDDKPRKFSKAARLTVSMITVIAVFLVCVSRVYLGYHTVKQVFIGLFLGSFTGLAWYYLMLNYMFPRLGPILLQSFLGTLFYLRDSSNVNNVWYREQQLCLKDSKPKKN